MGRTPEKGGVITIRCLDFATVLRCEFGASTQSSDRCRRKTSRSREQYQAFLRAQERKTLELDPNFLQAHSVLGRTLLEKAMYNEDIAEFEKELAISSNSTSALYDLGRAYAMAGRRAEAQKVLGQLDELSKHRYISQKSIATIYAALGEKDKAFERLERAY